MQATEQSKLEYLQKLAAFAENCMKARDWDMVINTYEQMLGIYEDPRVLVNLGLAYVETNMRSLAIKQFQRALELKPGYKEALLPLADSLQETGDTVSARVIRYKALRQADGQRERVTIESAILFGATVLGTQQDYMGDMVDFCQRRLSHLYPHKGIMALPDPVKGRKIRIGYLSADFNMHTVMMLLWPLFAQFDQERFELFFYSNSPYTDGKTEELKALGTFRPIHHLSDRYALATIRQDRIDLLVDLSGYSSGQRLSLIARKPAPRIATGLGFITPIGSPMVDYALLDPWMLLDDSLIPEKSAGIRSNLFFAPVGDTPLELPDRDVIAFGSGNALYKLTPPVVKLWSEILKRVPGSVLRLKSKTLSDPGVQTMIAKRFDEHGITPDRLHFTGTTTRGEHMRWYSSVDIALDPFPYQGGYTTLETLYMGCPVISLDTKGISTTIAALSLCGLDSYIANSAQEYVALASSLGLMMQSLSPESRMKIREHCRESLEQSVIMNAAGFVEDIENAYWRICQ